MKTTSRAAVIWAVMAVVPCIVALQLFEKPIWMDEFLHFAFGAYPTTGEAWTAIRQSIRDVNHGQTGTYLLLDYWLLRIFGAKLFWLRLPSLLSAVLLVSGQLLLFRRWRVLPGWQVAGVLSTIASPLLAMFIVEARPYLPLTAAVVGTFAYYCEPPDQRKDPWVRITGYGSVVWGALMHPYFALYWATVAVIAFVYQWLEGHVRPGVTTITRHLQPALVAAGAAIVFGIGALTWMQRVPHFQFDPYQFVPKGVPLWKVLAFAHVGYFRSLTLAPVAVVFAFVTAVGGTSLAHHVLRSRARSRVFVSLAICVIASGAVVRYSAFLLSVAWLRWSFALVVVVGFSTACYLLGRHLVPDRTSVAVVLTGFLVTFVALALSALLAWISIRQGYWVLDRQWVASIALVSIGFVGVASAATRLLPPRFHVPVQAIAAGLMLMAAVLTLRDRYLIGFETPRALSRVAPTEAARILPRNNDEWVATADLNVRSGGPVWPIFHMYYAPHDTAFYNAMVKTRSSAPR